MTEAPPPPPPPPPEASASDPPATEQKVSIKAPALVIGIHHEFKIFYGDKEFKNLFVHGCELAQANEDVMNWAAFFEILLNDCRRTHEKFEVRMISCDPEGIMYYGKENKLMFLKKEEMVKNMVVPAFVVEQRAILILDKDPKRPIEQWRIVLL